MEVFETSHLESYRSPWRAALLSLVQPGLGQLYTGKPMGFLWLALIPQVAMIGGYTAAYQWQKYLVYWAWSIPLLFFVIYMISIVDAYLRAARLGRNYYPRGYNHWLFYAIFLILPNAFQAYVSNLIRTHYLEPYATPTMSMAPTLIPGDRFYIDKKPLTSNRIHRGDLILFKNPDNREILYVKRVIGIPGDKIDFKEGELSVNGTPLTHDAIPQINPDLSDDFLRKNTLSKETLDGKSYTVATENGERNYKFQVEVPDEEFFVLGDNRGNSSDSRQFGTIPLADIVGKAIQIWFSSTPGTLRIRPRRVGILLNSL